jgi:hypothetical protein
MLASAQLEQVGAHQLVRADVQGAGDRDERLEGRAQFAALDPADVVAVQARLEAELLLGDTVLAAQAPDRRAEGEQIASWGGRHFSHAVGRFQAARPQSTFFTVTSYSLYRSLAVRREKPLRLLIGRRSLTSLQEKTSFRPAMTYRTSKNNREDYQ